MGLWVSLARARSGRVERVLLTVLDWWGDYCDGLEGRKLKIVEGGKR